MNHDEILIDNRLLEQWATDGGYVPSDDEEAEDERQLLERLRCLLVDTIGSENDYHLLSRLITGELAAAEFADNLGLHRSNGTRRVQTFLRQLRRKVASDAQLAERLRRWRDDT